MKTDKCDRSAASSEIRKAEIPPAGRLLSLKEAASYMGWTLWEMRRFVWSGEIPYVRRGERKLFIDRRDLDLWIETHKERWNEHLL